MVRVGRLTQKFASGIANIFASSMVGKPSVVCGALAAIVGPAVEIALSKLGVFAYYDDSDGLFGVGPWVPPLYFAFGVVAALLGEVASKNQQIRTGRVAGSLRVRP
jgi:hypothetical protein